MSTKKLQLILAVCVIAFSFVYFRSTKINSTNYFGKEFTILYEEFYRHGFDADYEAIQVLEVPLDDFKFVKDFYDEYEWLESPSYSTSSRDILDFVLAFSEHDQFVNELIEQGVKDGAGFEMIVLNTDRSESETGPHLTPGLNLSYISRAEIWIYSKNTERLYYLVVRT